MGAAREVTFACLAEPALFLGLLVAGQALRVAGAGRHARRPGSAAPGRRGRLPRALVVVSWFIVLLAENCRIPFDDPNTHLELTMIHEVMVLDHSGPALGMILYGAALKLFAFGRHPRSAGRSGRRRVAAGWTGPCFVGGMLAVAVVIGVVESTMARLRLTHVPILLVAACLLSAFGVIFSW